jgi:HPt (histidine-containing phosphotransfer) domain-containing protein
MKGQDDRFDFTMQLGRFGDDFWRLSRFARLFIEETPLRIKAIRLGLAARDAAAVRDAADELAEALHTLGAPEMAAIAADLARCGRNRDFGHARLLVIALQRNVDALLAMVKTWPPLAA